MGVGGTADVVGKPEGERDHLEDPCVDGRIILRWNLRKWDEGAWTGSIWLRDSWRALANAVMKLRVPQNAGNLLTI